MNKSTFGLMLGVATTLSLMVALTGSISYSGACILALIIVLILLIVLRKIC